MLAKTDKTEKFEQPISCDATQPLVPASKVFGALSFALDLTDGQPMGHSMQTCLIGMRIGQALGLSPVTLCDLYYSLLLKDAGCSSNASKLFHLIQSDEIQAKRSLKDRDWTKQGMEQLRYAVKNIAVGRPFFERITRFIQIAKQPPQTGELYAIRCERGASIARRLGFSADVSLAIASLDEHWNGQGYPMRIAGAEIPLLSRIMNLSQCAAIFWTIGGSKAAADVMKRRCGRWFDPELVKAALALTRQNELFQGLDDRDLVYAIAALEPVGLQLHLDDEGVDAICTAFSEVIDTKSPFTYRHSAGVAKAAVATGRQLGFGEAKLVQLRRAGLLHDIGKLAVPNSILEKPGKLDAAEWEIVKKHPFYTREILRQVPGFEDLSDIAASHHERLDGRGYFRGLCAQDLSLEARLLAVSDVYDALAAARPYRKALPREEVFSIMGRDAPHALDIDCLEALKAAPEAEVVLSAETQYILETEPPQSSPYLAPQFA
ncbi:MAG: HD-GYP domain-containing protein [Janthinobacterium lividum]